MDDFIIHIVSNVKCMKDELQLKSRHQRIYRMDFFKLPRNGNLKVKTIQSRGQQWAHGSTANVQVFIFKKVGNIFDTINRNKIEKIVSCFFLFVLIRQKMYFLKPRTASNWSEWFFRRPPYWSIFVFNIKRVDTTCPILLGANLTIGH